MESKRQSKISRLIQKDLSEIFQNDYQNFFGPVLITVTKARVTPDLSLARIFLSIFGNADKNIVLENIKKQSWEIRKKFGLRAKNQLRIIPNFEFTIDDSLDYIEKIETLLKK
ncbi:MAG: ribosome-binding factor A [Bacteroidales bacterium]|nr:ribosome-binding factor A [Bacteroidales bacterium]